MVKRFNPFPDPKKGKGRMILKKPAGIKTASWSKVPYQRHNEGGGFLRRDQTKWHRTIQQLLKATDTQILDILMKDNFLPSWEGCICPFCNKGVLVPLSTRSQRETKEYRCNKKNCQKLFTRFICTPSSLWFVVPKGTVSKHKLPHFFFDWLEFRFPPSTCSPTSTTKQSRG